uniref:Spermatogenesis associated 7 n=1 Tax=Iconisemion striatum TaxID=60296 RepID=A0A1A7YM33_9TELE
MVSHYKKIYSAKAAIDTSVPKSLLQSVKYKDQIRKEQLRNGVRPQSALSFSQRNSRTSCLSAQYDDRPYLCSRSSVISSSKFTSSFNNKDVVYPSNKVSAHYSRPSSEMKYQSPDFQRKQSTFSLGALRDQDCYKAFQDPVKKTYSGDLLQKHSQHFTQEKPFTPKTLKSEKSSYLSKYRYYRAPKIKSSQEGSNSGQMQQETCEQSAENRKSTQESEEPSQECSAEHEWFGDQVYRTALSPSGQEESVHQVDATAVNIPDDYVHTSLDSDQKQADIHNDGQFEELEYLGKTLSEVLHVSSNTQSEDVETAQGPHTNSDDEF